MKKVLIVGINKNGSDAVSNIIFPLIENYGKDNMFYCLGFAADNLKDKSSSNIINIPIKNPFVSNYFYRILRKFMHIVKIDNAKLASLYIYRSIRKYCKKINFDLIISMSGRFCYTVASYKYAKKKNIRLKIVYFDPFVDNIFSLNKKMRIRTEKKWLEKADKIYYNNENISPKVYNNSNKFIPFKIPIEHQLLHNKKKSSNYFMYGGTFYKGIREVDQLYKFAKKLANTKYYIRCYSNLINPKRDEKIKFYPLLNHDLYVRECVNSDALIYIGNNDKNVISSKYLEYIAMRKIIIGINVGKSEEIRKYPFYFDANDSDLLNKINIIDKKALNNYNPYIDFADRNPNKIFNEIFD